jgi:hypothetical protein
MKKQLFSALTLTTMLLSLSGCGFTGTGIVGTSTTSTTKALAVAPKTKAEFVKAVADLGVKLTDAQLDIISKSRNTVPNGTFASRPAANLTAEQNLETHFLKHGHEFTPKVASAAQYLQQATDLAAGKRGELEFYFDTTSFAKGYQSNVVRWNVKTKEMTAVRPDGAVTTYYLNFSLKPSRFVIVPKF